MTEPNISSANMSADDDYGDETELEIIIESAQREAENFGEHALLSFGEVFHPAKWLNPPRPVTT